ncbi:Wgr family protein [Pseudomonas syringae pv. cilantro]|uniref:Wgr family protein n=3 Tax=Pseudomonas syringae group TaxID=136849 RepID=A0A0N0X8M9_PSESX|nr:Wgr family protein [Pseudomonas syringae pv. cilantro]KPW72663.1 hypothetical protein ALO76_200053 [Pseudomonas syringae pv. coriandricola]KWS54927.1 hypothetical protein AL055_08825 [Pseudomonas amygdali pv. morsprunorum]POD00988.1 hypothetical protein BKM20_25475 [Pseudomonas avellanae]RML40714.1 hypothetical protein ALQ95_200180 [Pseudomonas syringae pv. ribicola]RMP02915.1 hypothetical protein ALQ30_200556 [Pseudomonas syringae pv. persicae]RMV48558.1 hypothetical protein ALP09_200156 
MQPWRWENETRWYEVELTQDLFGDWLIVRRWGGLHSRHHGKKTERVFDQHAGLAMVETIDAERKARKPPYLRM